MNNLCYTLSVDVLFASETIATLYTREAGHEIYPAEVLENFYYHLAAISAAESEGDLLMLRSLPLSILGNVYFIRLGPDWVLSFSVRTIDSSQVAVVDLQQELNVREEIS